MMKMGLICCLVMGEGMKIQEISNRYGSQFYVNIPLAIMMAMKWNKGDELKFEVLGRDKLKIEKVRS